MKKDMKLPGMSWTFSVPERHCLNYHVHIKFENANECAAVGDDLQKFFAVDAVLCDPEKMVVAFFVTSPHLHSVIDLCLQALLDPQDKLIVR